MSFTWKFEKPVLKTTLTSNGYSWPSGTSDPTDDILKAQIDELRENIDSVDDEGRLRCSSNYLTMDDCNVTYTANCPTVLINHYGTRYGGQCPSYRVNYYSPYAILSYDAKRETCSKYCTNVCRPDSDSDCNEDYSPQRHTVKSQTQSTDCGGYNSGNYSSHCKTVHSSKAL